MKRILIVIGCLLFGCSVSSSSPPDTGARHLSKRSFDSSNLDVASFAQSVFFNTVGSSIPLGWFLSSVINLFKSGFKGESILEKLRKEIKSAVLKGVTDYHQDQLYNQILSINSTMDGIYSRTLKNEPENFKPKLIELREDLFNMKHTFFPQNFKTSVTYNETLILYMAPFIIQYMGISYEIENVYANQSLSRDGAFQTNLDERTDFLFFVTESSQQTMAWALDKRLDYLKTEFGSRYYSLDEISGQIPVWRSFNAWTGFGIWTTVYVGKYALLAHSVRNSTKNFIQAVVLDTINEFRENAQLPNIPTYADKQINYPVTIYGEKCDTSCQKEPGADYWWCGLSLADWDYCSPPPDSNGTLRTRYDESCQDGCERRGYSYYWCNTQRSWDYCSPYSKEDVQMLAWPQHSTSLGTGFLFSTANASLVGSNLCASDCHQVGGDFQCNLRDDQTDGCSPASSGSGKPTLTYNRLECESQCGLSFRNILGQGTQFAFVCNVGSTWDYCSPRYEEAAAVPTPHYPCVTQCNSTGQCFDLLRNTIDCPTKEQLDYKKDNCPQSCAVTQMSNNEFRCSQSLCVDVREEMGKPVREDDNWFFAYHYIRNNLDPGRLSDDVQVNARLHKANPDNNPQLFPDIST